MPKKERGSLLKEWLLGPYSVRTSRGEVDLIDMQAMAYPNFKWIMVYRDHFSKYCVLRPLMTKRATEVSTHLWDIFLLFGAPAILQRDNGSEFTSHVITELKSVWPDLTIVYGKPRHPQSQGSVERTIGYLKDMLIAWLADYATQDWTAGIKFVQFHKNPVYHSGIKCSPCSAMFGCEARVGLISSSLPQEIISTLQTENDLLAATENFARNNHTATPAAAWSCTLDSPSLVESMFSHIAQIKHMYMLDKCRRPREW